MTAALRRDDFEERAVPSYQVGAIARTSDPLSTISLPQMPAASRRPAGSPVSQLAVVAPEPSRPVSKPVVRSFPKHAAAPSWLPLLIGVQRGTFALTTVLVAAVLALYGWTVVSQQRWASTFERLKHLQQFERELMSAIGTLKHDLTEGAAQPEAGMAPMTPTDTLEVPAAPARPLMPSEPESAPRPWERQRPVGY
ncbi:MAG: hypothetical protein VKK04_18390 [Synechococcales bacterium]|nr:hypothetical protein [Synechococcales bacterium]